MIDDDSSFTFVSGSCNTNEDDEVAMFHNGINSAIGYYLIATIQRYWVNPPRINNIIRNNDDTTTTTDSTCTSNNNNSQQTTLLLLFLQNIENDFRTSTDFLNNMYSITIRTAIMKLLRGLRIIITTTTTTATSEHTISSDTHSLLHDIKDALRLVDIYFIKTCCTAEEAIICFQIMTTCFLILRPPTTAIASIQSQMQSLFHHPKVIESQTRFLKCLSGNEKHPMFREDKTCMDLLYSRTCAAVYICEQQQQQEYYYTQSHIQTFQRIFLGENTNNAEYIAAMLDDNKWDELRVYKMNKVQTRAVAAAPATAAILVDPLIAIVAFVGVYPNIMNRVKSLSKPLSQFDININLPNLYNLRIPIIRICQGQSNVWPIITDDDNNDSGGNEQKEKKQSSSSSNNTPKLLELEMEN